jgi:hypothetical protein
VPTGLFASDFLPKILFAFLKINSLLLQYSASSYRGLIQDGIWLFIYSTYSSKHKASTLLYTISTQINLILYDYQILLVLN